MAIPSNIIVLFGALAHLVERNNGIVEAIGSTPIRSNSIPKPPEKIRFVLPRKSFVAFQPCFYSALRRGLYHVQEGFVNLDSTRRGRSIFTKPECKIVLHSLSIPTIK